MVNFSGSLYFVLPVNIDGHHDGRWEIVAEGPHHHQDLAGYVPRPPLDCEPPGSLQRQRDEADDAVGESELVDQVVDVGPDQD